MTLTEQIITIGMVVLGTIITRFLPFLLFPAGKPVPKYVQYLGKALPSAVFGLLVIYCLKNVDLMQGSHSSQSFCLWLLWLLCICGNGRCFSRLQEAQFSIWRWFSRYFNVCRMADCDADLQTLVEQFQHNG